MDDTTLKKLREIEDETSSDANLGNVFETEEKLNTLNVTEKAQKIELAEREMRYKEDQLKLESEKFEYQKTQSKKDNLVKIFIAVAAGIGGALTGFAKCKQVRNQRKYVHELYNIEQLGAIASGTGRALVKDGAMPKI